MDKRAYCIGRSEKCLKTICQLSSSAVLYSIRIRLSPGSDPGSRCTGTPYKWHLNCFLYLYRYFFSLDLARVIAVLPTICCSRSRAWPPPVRPPPGSAASRRWPPAPRRRPWAASWRWPGRYRLHSVPSTQVTTESATVCDE